MDVAVQALYFESVNVVFFFFFVSRFFLVEQSKCFGSVIGGCRWALFGIGASDWRMLFFFDDRYFLVCAEVIGDGSGFEILARSQT